MKGILFIALCCLVHLSAQCQTTDSMGWNNEGSSDEVGVSSGPIGASNTGGKDSIYSDSSVNILGKFVGGDNAFVAFVSENFQYPSRCLDEGISGSVKLRFVLDTKGRISRISAEEETKSCPEFTQEAIRVLKISSGQWIPAFVNGKAVSSWKVLPIQLRVE
ncbi:MAG: energy transducer TonB [Bacteroidia bacterium]|nr:energy transducer TonB [Bacteroidia bacterium]